MKILTDPRSGSYQGITSSRNRFGQYVRTRAVPVQPRTPRQTGNRGFLTAGSSAWRSLTDAQRTLWNDYAASISRTDSLGSSYTPTGASVFTGSITTTTDLLVTDPPTLFPTYVLTLTDITYTDPTPGPEALEITIGLDSADNRMIVETSGPVSPGVTSAASVRRWRGLPNTADANFLRLFPMTSPVDVITNYKFLFPSPLVGQVIWFRVSEVFFATGEPAGITNRLKQTFRLVIV